MGGRGSASQTANTTPTTQYTAEERILMENAFSRKRSNRKVPESSQRAFAYNWREAKRHIEQWGYDGSVFQNLNYTRGSKQIGVSDSTRTLNDILEMCNREDARNSVDLRYGIIDGKKFLLETQAVQMVRGTVLNIIEKKRRGEW